MQDLEQAYLKGRKYIRFHLMIKRCFDLLVASLLIPLLCPVLVLIALAVKLTSPGPILFRQERMGKLGKGFEIYKFRSMIDGAIHQGAGLSTYKDDPRLTPIGKFLREYHLDELPQIFNIWRGDMSLVGPRPLLCSELPTYSDWEKRRLLMAPGLTGWQQINGGELLDPNERMRLDIWYVDNWNFWLDLLIILRTIPVVLAKKGVYGVDGWRRGRGVG